MVSRRSAYIAVMAFGMLSTNSVCEQQGQEVKGDVRSYGILKVTTAEKTEKASETTSGFKRTAHAVVSEQTDKIPATLGVRFGFEYCISGLPKNETVTVRRVVTHPVVITPDGKEKRGYTTDSKYETEADGTIVAVTGYAFDHAFELVPGEWKIEVWYKDRKVANKTFAVYRPEKGK